MITVWAWKYSLSFQVVITKVKVSFSIEGIPFFYTMKCPAGVIHGLLHLVFFSDQGCTDDGRGDSQVKEQFFTWF